MTIAFSQAHMMASDGRCKTFDEQRRRLCAQRGLRVLVLRRLRGCARRMATASAPWCAAARSTRMGAAMA
jgi:hypothetical protein